MSLFLETVVISLCMIVLSALPLFSPSLRRQSKLFYLLGTGALAGILLFDLLPDLFEMGGKRSLIGAGVVWIGYSFFHLWHLKHHHKNDGLITGHGHAHGNLNVFLASMITHCLASGILLAVSRGYSEKLNHTVFWALLAHKAYESLTVSSVLIEREKSRSKAVFSVSLYALSLPLGVALTLSFHSLLTPNIAILATSLAAGTLLGCLIFDFLLPSLHQVRNRWVALAWISMGLLSTQFLLKTL
ncbi:MAG: ZIP family metal transporter [Bdellovibrionales bacterium]|nr:ZIP family metal transporter [Oligoflexia bacterium]